MNVRRIGYGVSVQSVSLMAFRLLKTTFLMLILGSLVLSPVASAARPVPLQNAAAETPPSEITGNDVIPPAPRPLPAAMLAGKTWTGAVSQDWHTPANWTPAGVPTAGDDVLIPATTTQPSLAAGDAAVHNLQLDPGVVLDLAIHTLTVGGVVTNAGTLKQTRYVADGASTAFLQLTDATGTQIKYSGVEITPTVSSPTAPRNSAEWRSELRRARVGTSQITAPTQSPTLTVELAGQMGGWSVAVVVSGTLTYVGSGPRMIVVDVSTPATPTLVGQSAVLPSIVSGIAVSGAYAYVTDWWGGFYVLAIADPAYPTEVGRCDLGGDPLGIAVAGDYAYVTDSWSGGLHVVDITDPDSPTQVSYYDTAVETWDIAVAGDYAYLAGSGLRIVNIADPLHPTAAGSYGAPGYWTQGVTVAGDYAYVAAGDGLHVITVTNPLSPTRSSFYALSDTPTDVAVTGDYAYVTTEEGGMYVVTVADPVSPTLAGRYLDLALPNGITAAADYLYIADDNGLYILGVTNPISPTAVGFYDTPGLTYDLAVVGDYTYVADGYSGLQILNTAVPTAPTAVGSYDTPGFAYRVAVADEYAYVADDDQGLRILNIADPAHPAEVGAVPGDAWDVAAAGDYAYIAGRELRIVNTTNPISPTVVSTVSIWAEDIVVAGDYVYVANNGLRIFNVATPTQPTLVSTFSMDGIVDIAIADDYAYVAAGNRGLYIITLANPAHPQLAGSWEGAYVEHVAAANGYAYVSDDLQQIRVIEVTDVAHPTEVGASPTLLWPHELAVVGAYVYVADCPGGVSILRVSGFPHGPLDWLTLTGPGVGQIATTYTFTAAVGPITATRPITYTWEATGQLSVTHHGNLHSTATFQWETLGNKTITVTADNAMGAPIVAQMNVVIQPWPAPMAYSVTPASGANNGVTHLTHLIGANFQPSATVTLKRTGQSPITATNVVWVSAAHLTGDVDLTGAALGMWNVVVGNPDGQTGTLSNGFTVYPPPPTYTLTIHRVGEGTVTPGVGVHPYNTGTVVTLTAAPAPDWAFAGWTGAVSGPTSPVTVTLNAHREVTAHFTLAPGPAPVITSITPEGGENTGVVHITRLDGEHFQVGATFALIRPGFLPITATAVAWISATQLTGDLDLSGAAPGWWHISVHNPDGQSALWHNGFAIRAYAPPTVTAILPNTGVNTGTVHIHALTGSNFQLGATVQFIRAGQPPLTGTQVLLSATQMSCNFDLTGAEPGPWDVVVTNPDGHQGILPAGFTVQGPSGRWVTVAVSGEQTCVSHTGGVQRCFAITAAAAFPATVRFYFTEAERNDLSLSEVVVYQGNHSAWLPLPGPYTRGGVGNAQYVQVQVTNAAARFALSGPPQAPSIYLPLILRA